MCPMLGPHKTVSSRLDLYDEVCRGGSLQIHGCSVLSVVHVLTDYGGSSGERVGLRKWLYEIK